MGSGGAGPTDCMPKAYDHGRCREDLAARGIARQIVRRKVESSQRLGRYRWVVERTIAWLRAFRRLAVRYEQRAELHRAFLTLGCAMICCRTLAKGF